MGAIDLWNAARIAENAGDFKETIRLLGRAFIEAEEGSGIEKAALAAWHRVRRGGRI